MMSPDVKKNEGTETERPSATAGGPSRACARGRVLKVKGSINTSNPLRTRACATQARVREGYPAAFYGPAIADEVDSAVNYALESTGNSRDYRRAWCFYCLRLGVNTFLDQLDEVLSCARQGEIRQPAQAFHARLRRIKSQLDKRGGAR